MTENEVMTAKDVAKYLKLRERTVNSLATKGKLPGVKIGRQWRFRKSQIDAIFVSGQMAELAQD